MGRAILESNIWGRTAPHDQARGVWHTVQLIEWLEPIGVALAVIRVFGNRLVVDPFATVRRTWLN